MKKLIFGIANSYKKIKNLKNKLQGKTEKDVINQQIVTGKAWEDFCDTLKTAGTSLLYGNAPLDPFQQAEGIRYLSRLTRAGLDAFIEHADPQFPSFKRMVHETVKLGSDNPDNHYSNAQVSGAYEYRIYGNRNSVFYLGFFTQNGSYGSTGGLSPCGVIEDSTMHFEEDGSFEIFVTKEKKGKNWLKIEAETTLLILRQTFMDKINEVSITVNIECIDGPKKPEPLSPELVYNGLNMAGTFVAGASFLFSKWTTGFTKHPNQLPLFSPEVSNAAGGDANIWYYHSYWKLADDEALYIHFTPPNCKYWNFQLNNYWMESLDYRYFNIHINKHNAKVEADGSVKIFVAHNKPNHQNWIDTAHHNEGTMLLRWAYADDNPQPSIEVVKESSIKNLI
jgi:hypothetical protein